MTVANGRSRAVVTIGAFDGVHRGHRALLQTVVERAGALGALSWCVTFHPHPDVVMRPRLHHAYLADRDEQEMLIREQGIALVQVLRFTPEMSKLTARAFIEQLSQQHLLEELWIGPDFALGQGRAGTAETLAHLGQEMGFRLELMPPFTRHNEVVSSTRIRGLLSDGDVTGAADLLGRPYALLGTVQVGAGRGTPIGFPTANVVPAHDMALPGDGVYVIEGTADGVTWAGVANLGGRPTFGDASRLIEAHLFDFNENLHGKTLRVAFLNRIRGVQTFGSVDALVTQIRQDAETARRWFTERAAS